MASAPLTATAVWLRTTLKGAKPAMWPKLLVTTTKALQTLHQTIQAATGCWNAHMFEFDTDDDASASPTLTGTAHR